MHFSDLEFVHFVNPSYMSPTNVAISAGRDGEVLGLVPNLFSGRTLVLVLLGLVKVVDRYEVHLMNLIAHKMA